MNNVIQAFSSKSRRRPTLPLGLPSSTIGSKELNFRVRDGIGCDLLDITTGNFLGASMTRGPGGPLRVALLVTRTPGARLAVCLRSMVKPHDLLVPVSSADCSASTPGLSTTWSRWGL